MTNELGIDGMIQAADGQAYLCAHLEKTAHQYWPPFRGELFPYTNTHKYSKHQEASPTARVERPLWLRQWSNSWSAANSYQ